VSVSDRHVSDTGRHLIRGVFVLHKQQIKKCQPLPINEFFVPHIFILRLKYFKGPANMPRLPFGPCKKNVVFRPRNFFCFLKKPLGPLHCFYIFKLIEMSHQMPHGHLCTVSMRHVSIRVPPSR